MDLFGQNILDFPSADDNLFLGRLPRISESEYLQDLGLDSLTDNTENRKVSLENDEEWSNDSAIYSEDANSDVTDTNSEIKSIIGSELGDEDSYLYGAVSFDQICKQDTSKSASINDVEEVHITEPEPLIPSQKTVESITFDDVIGEDIADVVPLDNEDMGIGLGLDGSSYLDVAESPNGQETDFCNEELLAGANLLITSDLVPDIDHLDQFESSSSHSLPDAPTSVPDLHVPLGLDQMLSDSDDLSEETEDVLKTIDLNDVLKQRSTSGTECGEKSKSAFENLFADFKNFSENAEKSINIKEELHSFNADCEETDYGLEQFDFNLCNATDIEKTDLPGEEEVTSHIIDDFLTSMFGDDASEDANDYNDLLNSILTEENIDTDYFNNESFDIDSVDPSCTSIVEAEKEKSIKTEVEDPAEPPQLQVNIKKEPEEEFGSDNFYWLKEHDYALPVTSSLFLTPPHSPGDDFEEKLIKKSLLVRKNLPSKARSQIVKFNKPKDLKFVMTLPVKGGEKYKKVNARSILKSKILHHSSPSGSKSLKQKSKSRSSQNGSNSSRSSSQTKTAKELVREILEKRNLAQHIQEKKEHVRNMKKRMREETQRDFDREEFSIGPSKARKAACLEDLRSKGDLKKYRKFEEERELHNSMERQRRIEMKDAYDVLKATIPSIRDNDKVSKLNILNTARDYYLDLEDLVRRTTAAKQRELDRRKYLMERINLLKLQII